MEFLGPTDDQIEQWRNGEAPLGMTPEQFRDFQSSLADVLAPFGIRQEDALVQIVGSAVRGCSGWTKRMDNIEHTPESRQRLAEWLGDDEGPVRRPFDVMNKLGLGKPSDYDVSFHSDRMVEIARQHWRSEGSPGEFSHKHGFVDKKIFHDAFRELDEWTKHWEEQLGREGRRASLRARRRADATPFAEQFQHRRRVAARPVDRRTPQAAPAGSAGLADRSRERVPAPAA